MASQVLKKYEDEFFEVVEPKLNLKTLKRKNVITEGLITAIENADRCNGLEKLYEHLQHNADVDTLREYCKMILTAGGYPKMQKLGKKMLDELPPTEGNGQTAGQISSQEVAQGSGPSASSLTDPAQTSQRSTELKEEAYPPAPVQQQEWGSHQPEDEQPTIVMPPQLPVPVHDASNPNLPLSEFTDTSLKPDVESDDGMESYHMMSHEERQAIKRNFALLTKNLNPTELIDEMVQYSLLMENEHSDIETKTKESRRDGASALLKALQRRQPGSLKVFIGILGEVKGHKYLAKALEDAYSPGAGVPMETDLPTPRQHVEAGEGTVISAPVQETEGQHQPMCQEEGQPAPFVLPQLPVPVHDASNPNWPLSDFTDASFKPPKDETDDGMESYRMASNPRGMAVIINNKIFTGKMKRREETDLDAESLFRLFKGLGYEVRLFNDLTGKKMLSTLRDVAKRDHRKVDSLVVCILTHGVEGQLYGSDEELIRVDDVFKPFNGYNCPTLVGKPKVFLMQACRGGVFDYGVESTDNQYYQSKEEPSLEDMKKAAEEMYRMQQKEFEATDGKAVVLPAEADFAVVFVTVPGYVSWRNSAFGSWFIKAFVDIMTENVRKRHFLEILTLVNNRVALNYQSRDGNKQIIDSSIRLRKFLYFNPPSCFRMYQRVTEAGESTVISAPVQVTGGQHQPMHVVDEQPSPFVLPHLPVTVSDASNPNWPLSDFTDASFKPADESDDGMESYRMASNPRGMAVIINNKIFTGKMKRREGTDLDAENLFRLFKGLGYEVRLFNDLTGKKMLSTLQHVAKLDHRSMDSLVVCILTHGVEGQLYGSDEELIRVDDVFKPFNGYNCPTLVGKPKVFLMQACRGGVFDYRVESTDNQYYQSKEEPSLEDMKNAAEEMYRMQQKEFEATDGKAVVLPAEADFAVVFVTVPGYISWRNSAFGSWFIKAFVDIMTENVRKRHFLEILTLVNNRVALNYQSRDGNKQIIDSSIRLRKFLFFKPPGSRMH